MMRFMRRLRCQVQEPTLQWVIDHNRNTFSTSLLIGSVTFLFHSVSLIIYGKTRCATVMLMAFGGCAATQQFLSRSRAAPISALCVLGTFCFVDLVFSACALMEPADDMIYRTRTQAINTILSKFLPTVYGYPVAMIWPLLLFTCVVDSASLVSASWLYGDPTSPRPFVTSVLYTMASAGFSWMTYSRVCSICEAHKALVAEKAMMEAIITMLCDATVWLSDQSCTIVRADQHFRMLIGRDMTGASLGDCLAEGELERLRECLERAKAMPVLLPTTVQTNTGARLPVEMFIVGSRSVRDAWRSGDSVPTFLIGVRTACRQPEEAFQEVELRAEHRDLLAADGPRTNRRRNEECQSLPTSMPTTTPTGRIFERLEADSVSVTVEGASSELRRNLEKVCELGRAERWLVAARDLPVAVDQLLGMGSFGVVLAGWLHGSPVAVKAARHLPKEADVAHLVNIANEIRILRHVRHPSVVLFHGAVIDPASGEVMLILERIRGPTLHQYVVRHSADVEIHGRFQLLLDVACALRYLHAQLPQVVHGDLKANNVMVEPALPRAKLVDFGLSRLLTKEASPLGGTLAWQAPEIINQPDSRPKASADVFSFGRLAYLIVVGRLPLKGISRQTIVRMARDHVPQPLSWQEKRPLQAECRRLCAQALCLEPQRRPGMDHLHGEISAWALPGDAEGLMPALELAQAAGEMVVTPALGWRERAPAPTLARDAGGPGGRWKQAAFEEGDLLLPALEATKEGSKRSLVLEVARRWNFAVSSGRCCRYHAALSELQRVGREMMMEDCSRAFSPYEGVQCGCCGTMAGPGSGRSACSVCRGRMVSRAASARGPGGAHAAGAHAARPEPQMLGNAPAEGRQQQMCSL
uniref:Protein kinase domain-containing protein n=1 Tax=Alexandrium monilatum TaxID=311494 RepID=A0A7S4T6P1_9DINO